MNVILESYVSEEEALKNQLILKGENIKSKVMRIDSPSKKELFGIAVEACDLTRSIELLDVASLIIPSSVDHCPRCDSLKTSYDLLGFVSRIFFSIFAALIGRLQEMPRKPWTCATCGCRWEVSNLPK